MHQGAPERNSSHPWTGLSDLKFKILFHISMQDNNINDAVKIFSDVLKHRVKHYGGKFPV